MTEYITLLSLLNNYFSQAKILFHFDLLYHSKYSLSCILSNLFFCPMVGLYYYFMKIYGIFCV